MPKLIIDEREVEVPAGTKVIEAAERLGIMIPRFCYHEALGSVGACRLCAVKFLEGPVKGVQMSCMTVAKDGMVVSTTHPEALAFRQSVIEWLMLNHPHDCPVCDEGGNCLLQDMTVAGGHGIRRYEGTKRTFRDQYLGPFVQHEMNRCIHCWRCRRFYQEYAGYRDLGAMQIGNRTYFGRFREGPLESPFAGNLIDLCPTGVFTDRPARFKGRRWDFERAPSVCLHCSLGCNTTVSARYREVMRVEGRKNPEVNGFFVCDRGRFAYGYANLANRPRQPRVDGREVSPADAMQAAGARLQATAQRHGPDAVACLGSARSSLETQGALHRLARAQGWAAPRYFADAGEERRAVAAVSGLTRALVRSLADLEKADAVLVLGADPLAEAPMLALALRQAARKGAHIAVVDPRPVELAFAFERVAVRPSALAACLGTVARAAVERETAERGRADALGFYDGLPTGLEDATLAGSLVPLGERLRKSKRPVLVCGTSSVAEGLPPLAAGVAELLRGGGQDAGLFFLLPGPNAFGAALWSPEDAPSDWVSGIEEGRAKALVVAEADPFWSYPDRSRLEAALERLECLVVLDHLPSPALDKAHVVLPTTTVFEAVPWTVVNQEGRVQRTTPVHRGGTPISQVSAGGHPPRVFRNSIPGGEPQPAWAVLAGLSEALGGGSLPAEPWSALAGHRPELAPRLGEALPPEHLVPEQRGFRTPEPSGRTSTGSLELVLGDLLYGSEEFAAHSDLIRGVEGPPRFLMHPADAARRGLAEGARVSVALPGGSVAGVLHVQAEVAEGVVILPRHRAVTWQRLGGGPVLAVDVARVP